MKRIWAPWRIDYIRNKKETGCIFCEKPKHNDKEGLILFRGDNAFTLMNLYPYTNGHIMISPYKHIDNWSGLNKKDKIDILEQIDQTVQVLTEILNPEGFNIGANIGESAGAGIKDHIHFHVVPRWNGDTNFMPVFGNTKIIIEGLIDSWEELNPVFNNKFNA